MSLGTWRACVMAGGCAAWPSGSVRHAGQVSPHPGVDHCRGAGGRRERVDARHRGGVCWWRASRQGQGGLFAGHGLRRPDGQRRQREQYRHNQAARRRHRHRVAGDAGRGRVASGYPGRHGRLRGKPGVDRGLLNRHRGRRNGNSGSWYGAV